MEHLIILIGGCRADVAKQYERKLEYLRREEELIREEEMEAEALLSSNQPSLKPDQVDTVLLPSGVLLCPPDLWTQDSTILALNEGYLVAAL